MPAHAFKNLLLFLLLTTALSGCDKFTAQTEDGSADEKAAMFEASPSYQENTASGNYLAARFALSTNDLSRANQYFEHALDAGKKDEAPLLMERALPSAIGAGDFRAALALAKNVDTKESTATAQLALTVLLADAFAHGKAEKVNKLLPDLREDGFGKLIKPLAETWALVLDGKPEKASARLDALAVQYPSIKSFAMTHKAMILSQQKDEKKAESAFDDVLGQDASLRTVWLAGRYYESRNQVEKARKIYKDIAEKLPETTLPKIALRRLDQGEIDHNTGSVIDAKRGMAAALYDISSILMQEGSSRLAVLYAQLSDHLASDDVFTKVLLGNIFIDLGQYDEAAQYFNSIDPKEDLHILARFRLADIAEAQGDDAAAEKNLEQLTEDPLLKRQALTQLGDLFRRQENFEKAVSYYSHIIGDLGKPSAQDWPLFYARAMCYERLDKWNFAEADLQEALHLSPHQPEVLNYLAYSWADHGLKLEESLAMLQKALSGAPNDPYIIDSVGWALFKSGRYEEAVPYLEAAVQELPEDPTINDHLGDIYWRVGRRLEANFQWTRALRQSEKGDRSLVEELRAKLEEGLPHISEKTSVVSTKE